MIASGDETFNQSVGAYKLLTMEQPTDLISFLYVNCLFPSKDLKSDTLARSAICQSKHSRSLVYYLLYLLIQHDVQNINSFVRAIGHHDHSTSSSSSQWNYNPELFVKSKRADVGLSNQGGTCYMNALLQQIFHVQKFSRSLMNIDPNATAMDLYNQALNIEPSKDQLAKSESCNILFQLQVLFGYLFLSQKKFYDTLPFCNVIRDYDGEVIRLSEQKDINEFAGMLFDKLENHLEVKDLLAKTFQGKIVWQTRSIETPYRSDREESFYMITAEVKNKSSLEVSEVGYVTSLLYFM
jgi:ubiquitin carboxyl-terminal hydrolase 9/24